MDVNQENILAYIAQGPTTWPKVCKHFGVEKYWNNSYAGPLTAKYNNLHRWVTYLWSKGEITSAIENGEVIYRVRD